MPFSLPVDHPQIRLSQVPPYADPHDQSDSELLLEDHYPATPPAPSDPNFPPSPDLSAHAADRLSDHSLLYPASYHGPYTRLPYSPYSSVSNTPVPSRPSSPLPPYVSPTLPYSSGVSSCSSESDSDPEPSYLSDVAPLRRRTRREERRRWSIIDAVRRHRRREAITGFRAFKRAIRLLVRHPYFPKTPVTILLTLTFLTLLAVSVTFLVIYILNPDKEPLPWRGYCTIPRGTSARPPDDLPPSASFPYAPAEDFTPLSFPPPDLDDLSPAGVFVGVFSVDNAVERRMLIRSTWASHPRSREGADDSDAGLGTSRTVVRFILGQPCKEWERRIKLEMEMYNDMVILPVQENMNSGKSYAYFTWAASSAWVPPLYAAFPSYPPPVSYTNATTLAPVPADHDSLHVHRDYLTGQQRPWVRPDYVVKVDDDSFVMLAELEARLRVELHRRPGQPAAGDAHASPDPVAASLAAAISPSTNGSAPVYGDAGADPAADPLVFWGYLVKNRFMAGELYALSFSLARWVATDPQVRGLTRGAEDKQTAKWMRLHPRADEVRWASERCWIYDHPRAGTVYSHGFLFPSEVARVQRVVLDDIAYWRAASSRAAAAAAAHPNTQQGPQILTSQLGAPSAYVPSPFGANGLPPSTWAYSSVSKFRARYAPPVPDLALAQSVEALVEGSEMSLLHEGGARTPLHAWKDREGRRTRYGGARVGGTVVVHFIKKNMWFLETADAMLLGEDVTEAELAAAPPPPPPLLPASMSTGAGARTGKRRLSGEDAGGAKERVMHMPAAAVRTHRGR
ncbi:hypothetical protein BKA93DRAFT_722295 [Sparassis latifolia]